MYQPYLAHRSWIGLVFLLFYGVLPGFSTRWLFISRYCHRVAARARVLTVVVVVVVVVVVFCVVVVVVVVVGSRNIVSADRWLGSGQLQVTERRRLQRLSHCPQTKKIEQEKKKKKRSFLENPPTDRLVPSRKLGARLRQKGQKKKPSRKNVDETKEAPKFAAVADGNEVLHRKFK